MEFLRWDPFAELREIQERMNRILQEAAPPATTRSKEYASSKVWSPPVDVLEKENEIVFKVDLPGVQQQDIHIELEGDTLTIRGERKFDNETQKEQYVRIERVYGPFQRSFTISTPIQSDQVQASFRNGVLEIRLPKKEEVRPKRIQINVG